jgi:hypothetical protein
LTKALPPAILIPLATIAEPINNKHILKLSCLLAVREDNLYVSCAPVLKGEFCAIKKLTGLIKG